MTIDTSNFQPRWACPPGETILELLAKRDIPRSDFPRLVDLDENTASAVLDGDRPVSADVAARLSEALGASVEFWLQRDAQYQHDKALVEKDAWAASFPTKFMVQEGWIRNFDGWIDRISALLEFFDVEDFHRWDTENLPAIQSTKFRTSRTFQADACAVSAWLRQAERLIDEENLPEWNPEVLHESLERLKSLTRMKRPESFIPVLQEITKEAGVGLTVVKAPPGCPVSGATLNRPNGRRLLLLSGRHLSDDHLWFTFFHEIAHLILHEAGAICDEPELKELHEGAYEVQANEWAADFLVDPELINSLSRGRITSRRVVKVAHQAGVSRGIVVGQLQYRGLVSYTQLNRLKQRYQWTQSGLALRSTL